MPIQIIDGFQVNTASPIDSRIVASGSAARNAIPYKYEGLRVFDKSDGIPYVWLNNTWSSENANGVVGSGTTASYVPLITSTNVIGNSIIYQLSGKIGVSTITPSEKFEVNGNIKVSGTGYFIGDGQGITNINATNIASGNLSLNRLTNGSTGWILSGASGQPAYVNPNQITVGTSSVSLTSITASNVSLSTSSTSTNYVLFSPNNTGSGPVRTNSSIMYDASAGNLTIEGLRFGDSNNYVNRRKFYSYQSFSVAASNDVTIGNISISTGIVCYVEATFVAKNLGSGMGGTLNYSSSKISGMFYNNLGTVTQVGSTTTLFNANNNSPGSFTLDPGTFAVSGANIQLKQVVSASTANSYSVIVDYNIVCCS